MPSAHKCTKSKSEYFPVSGIFPTRTKKDLHRNNLRYTAVVLTIPRKGRPENPNGTKRTAFNVNVSCGRRGPQERKEPLSRLSASSARPGPSSGGLRKWTS